MGGPAGAAVAPAAPARVTFGIQPAGPAGPDGRPYFSFAATPGAVIFDRVAALNDSDVPVAVQLYATDAVETAGGGFGLLAGTARPTGVGAWITLPAAAATVNLPARTAKGPGTVVIPFRVHLPARVQPGEHSGGLVLSLQTVGTNATGQRIVLDQRVGTRVYVQVAGTLAPSLAVADLKVAYDGTSDPFGRGRVAVDYTLDNTGNANLAVNSAVSVSGLVGDPHQATPPRIRLLLPGAAVVERVVVAGLWPQLRLHTTVTAQPVVVTVSGAAPMAAVTASTSTWAVPWLLVALVAILAVAAVVVWRRRRRRPPAAPQPEVRQAVHA
jgi:hypothetical protein